MGFKQAGFIVVFLFSVLSHIAHAELQLNGLAANSELGREIFIAAIYTEEPSQNPDSLIGNQVARRMELKVTAENWSHRSLNRMWVEDMALNHDAADIEAQQKNIKTLTSLFTERFKVGDTIQIDFNPGQPVEVRLNNRLLGEIASSEIFPMLLGTWIGTIPRSTEFKNGLLAENGIDQALLARYNELSAAQNQVASSY